MTSLPSETDGSIDENMSDMKPTIASALAAWVCATSRCSLASTAKPMLTTVAIAITPKTAARLPTRTRLRRANFAS